MLAALLPKYLQEIQSLEDFLSAINGIQATMALVRQTSEPNQLEAVLQDVLSAVPDNKQWRIMGHSLAVSRMYAIYENYSEELLVDWIHFCTNRCAFNKLPDSISIAYPIGFSKIVAMLPSQRYPTLTVPSLVSNYHKALSGAAGSEYQIDPDCLTYHNNNLRINELTEIFKNCGISELSSWVTNSPTLEKHFGTREKLNELTTSKLANFIQYRNDSSHGIVSPDEIIGHEDLMDFTNFFRSLGDCLSQLVSWKKIELCRSLGTAHKTGTVTEVFQGAGAFILVSEGRRIEVGQSIFIHHGSSVIEATISSMQLNNVSVSEWEGNQGTELGLACGDVLPRAGAELYTVD